MSKRYHFISGLPRSGSTLLSTILNQNPNFNAAISSPLARFIRLIITESYSGPGYKLQCPESKRIELIQSLVETYHSHLPQEVNFNTNRGWTSFTDLLSITHPESKIICCVRDITRILDSFENLFRKHPFHVSSMYSTDESSTVFTRCDALMSPLSLSLLTPIVVRPGEFVQLIARNLGTVTTTGAITITATFDGYWE
jgi:sulfotransferase